MNVSDLIAQDEGLCLKVYDDATGSMIVPGYTVQGHPTIGYGRCLDTHGISANEAAFLRQGDILRVTAALNSAFPWFSELNQARQAVIISMAFQLGIAGFADFKEMIHSLSEHDYVEAANRMIDSKWSKQTPARASRLASILITGELA